MSPIRVNADYESVLFLNQHAPAIVNQSIEFLAFFLDERLVVTNKKYNPDYLDYVENLTGRKIQLIDEGEYVNWWGELKNLTLEKKLNSKLTTVDFLLEQNWIEDLFVLNNISEIKKLDRQKIWLLKNPYLMSGQKFQTIFPKEEINEKNITFPVIAEPLLERCFDFSNYFFSNGTTICYENIVDNRFQFKGSKFSLPCSLDSLSFSSLLSPSKWNEFNERLKMIKTYYENLGAKNYSVDSFVYKKNDELFVYPFCEVNARRTMGSCAYELFRKFGKSFNYGALYLKKATGENFNNLRMMIHSIPNVILLSPGDTRFNMFLILANSDEELSQKIKSL